MPMRSLRLRSIAHAVAVCAALALVADLSDAHIHVEDECLRCIMVEVDGTSEPAGATRVALFQDSPPAGARARAASRASRLTHHPRAPPTLP